MAAANVSSCRTVSFEGASPGAGAAARQVAYPSEKMSSTSRNHTCSGFGSRSDRSQLVHSGPGGARRPRRGTSAAAATAPG